MCKATRCDSPSELPGFHLARGRDELDGEECDAMYKEGEGKKKNSIALLELEVQSSVQHLGTLTNKNLN